MNYTQHFLSAAFPPMSDEQFRALVDDIDLNGVRSPILLYEGKVIDGWHRYRACLELNVKKMRVADWDGEDPIGFVLSQNLHRRHLNPSQRSMIFAELTAWEKKVGRPSKSLSMTEITLEKAAELSQVSVTTMKHAKAATKAEPEVQEAVKAGKMSVSEAAALSKEEPEVQRSAVNKDKPRKAPMERKEMVPLEDYQILETNYLAMAQELEACDAVRDGKEVAAIKLINGKLNSMTAARDQWQNKCAEMTRQNNYLSSRVKKLESELSALKQQ